MIMQPLDGVAQLADVAAPAVALQRLQRAPASNLFGLRLCSSPVSRAKCCTSSGMSSRRSRSGGTTIGMTLRRKNRSSRNSPRWIASSRFLLVAAITRTSTLIVRAEPSRSTSCSCSTRSTLACVFGLMSPTSSRKIVPRSACSNLPICFSVAPVNEPFSWPNSSDSISSSGIAAQFTCTKRWPARGLLR